MVIVDSWSNFVEGLGVMFRNSYVNLPTKIAVSRLVFSTAFIACGVIGVATHSTEGHPTSPALYALTPFFVLGRCRPRTN